LAEERFHHGSDACIVCTSTLELGIDVGDLDRVLQAEAPSTVSSFLQRMGRTGRRAGQAANTTFFCETPEGVLLAVALVELAKAGWVERVPTQDRCWPVLIHQMLALALATDGVAAEEAWEILSQVPDFRGISRQEYDRLLAWMHKDGALRPASGRWVLGPKAQKRFGRKNFMELYAVFSSPQSYTVQTSNAEPLGTLSQAFVDRLVDGVSTFLLGGRAWAVVKVSHEDRRVHVVPAALGREPTWGGFLPQFLSFEICQQIRDILKSRDEYPYLDEAAKAVLAAQREQMQEALVIADGLEIGEGEVQWWTFAGGKINATLKYALEAVGLDAKIVPHNFGLRIRGDGVAQGAFQQYRARLSDPALWQDEKLWKEVAESLPNYRLSKFQALMPPWVEQEVVATYLLDAQGAADWLGGPNRRVFCAQSGSAGVPDPHAAMECSPRWG
jgi:ATP-dependent Lhr-like helicase